MQITKIGKRFLYLLEYILFSILSPKNITSGSNKKSGRIILKYKDRVGQYIVIKASDNSVFSTFPVSAKEYEAYMEGDFYKED